MSLTPSLVSGGDTTKKVPVGTIVDDPTTPGNKWIYLEVGSSSISGQVSKGGCTLGRPAMYKEEDGTGQCFCETNADAMRLVRKMILGLTTASVGKYCWFLYSGYGYGKHDKTQVAAGQAIFFKSGTASINQILGIDLADHAGTSWMSARAQGWIDSNSATNMSNTGDNLIKVCLFGA